MFALYPSDSCALRCDIMRSVLSMPWSEWGQRITCDELAVNIGLAINALCVYLLGLLLVFIDNSAITSIERELSKVFYPIIAGDQSRYRALQPTK